MVEFHRRRHVGFFAHEVELEFAQVSAPGRFGPRVDEVEEPCAYPETLPHLLIYANPVGRPETISEVFGGPVKATILGWRALRRFKWLIHDLRVRDSFRLRLIVAFVDEHLAVLGDGVVVRSTRLNAHEQHAVAMAKLVVHAALERRPFAGAHLEIRNHITWLHVRPG